MTSNFIHELQIDRNYHKATDNANCDVDGRVRLLCGTVTTNFAEKERCNSIRAKILGRQSQHQHEF